MEPITTPHASTPVAKLLQSPSAASPFRRGQPTLGGRPARIAVTLLFLLAISVAAQPAGGVPNRLAALETGLAQLSRLVSDQQEKIHQLQGENAAQATLLAQQQTQIATLQNADAVWLQTVAQLQEALAAEVAARQAADATVAAAARAQAEELVASEAAARASADEAVRAHADAQVDPLRDKLTHFSRNGNDVYLSGANLHIRNGTGHSYAQPNGLGNLVLGYNEPRSEGNVRTGSHNLVLGFGANYSHAGGIIGGGINSSTGFYGSVLGGTGNTASGLYSVVSGGYLNSAVGDWSTIGGGTSQTAPNTLSHIP